MNQIEYFTLTLDRKVETVPKNSDEHQVISIKEPIVIVASKLIPDVATIFPKEQSNKEIIQYLCNSLMEHIDAMSESELETDLIPSYPTRSEILDRNLNMANDTVH